MRTNYASVLSENSKSRFRFDLIITLLIICAVCITYLFIVTYLDRVQDAKTTVENTGQNIL